MDENSNRIFQMTIDVGKQERFRIFKGEGNDVRVLDVDNKKENLKMNKIGNLNFKKERKSVLRKRFGEKN